MDNLKVYKKKDFPELAEDFAGKKKYGKVYFNEKCFYVKKGLKWLFIRLDDIESYEIIQSSRQLRQCCGAPIYPTKTMLLTTKRQEHIYLDIEETANGDLKYSEALMERLEIIKKINYYNLSI